MFILPVQNNFVKKTIYNKI